MRFRVTHQRQTTVEVVVHADSYDGAVKIAEGKALVIHAELENKDVAVEKVSAFFNIGPTNSSVTKLAN